MPASEERMTHAEYIIADNDFATIDGILRTAGPQPSPAVLLQTHPRNRSDENLMGWPCPTLPARGIDTFAYNNRVTNSTAGTEVVTIWEDLLLDVAAAVQAMRDRGYRQIILYGHSAGGPLVAYYQNVAENGNAVFRDAAALSGFRGYSRGGAPMSLPPADGLVLQNATTGTAHSFLARLDGSVVDEATGRRDPDLDPFAEHNGFDPATGGATYAKGFLADYYRAQGARMLRLVARAQERLQDVASGSGRFLDDDVMVIPGIRAEPASVDLSLAARTQERWKRHGADATEFIESDRRIVPQYDTRNARFRDGGTVHTLRSFLSYRAVLVDPDGFDPDAVRPELTGVVQDSSNSNTARNVAGIGCPLLVTASTADTQVHLPHFELIYNAAIACPDKSVAVIAGGEHDMTPAAPGAGDTRAQHLEAIVEWLTDRFEVRPA